LSGLICDRSILQFAVAQQFHSSAWRSRTGDNRVTPLPNDCNVEDRHDPLAAARRAGWSGKCACRCGSSRALISNVRCRWRNRRRGCWRSSNARCRWRDRRRRGCGSGFNRPLAPYVRDAEGKRCKTCCNKRQRRHGYPAYRCGSHGVRPLAKSLARQHPPEMTLPRFISVIKGPATVTLISKLGGMLRSGVLRFCRGSASLVLRFRRLPWAPGVACLAELGVPSCEPLARFTARLHFFLKEMLELHPESLSDVPQA